MTSENVRYHAAGHLAAAALIAKAHPEAARIVLNIVNEFANHDMVKAPPAVKELLGAAINDPAANDRSIIMLEAWFVDPFNTVIERSQM